MKKRIFALLLAGAMLCSLPACTSQPGSAGPGGPSLSQGQFPPGVYTGEGQGFGGTIKVEVTLSADRIEKVEVIDHKETEGIGSKAVDAIPAAIVDSQSLQVDVISGATQASHGIMDAATAALKSAGVDSSSLPTSQATPSPEPSPSPSSVPSSSPLPTPSSLPTAPPTAGQDPLSQERVLEADVVVVGAGGAGMTAGIAAARAGRDKKVIILEKTAATGGNSILSTGGMNAAKTVYQDDNGWLEAAGLEKALAAAGEYPQLTGLANTVRQEYEAWAQAGSKGYFDSPSLFALDTMMGGKGKNDLELVSTLVRQSAGAIDWLDSIGASLHSVGAFGGASVRRIHRPVSSKGKIMDLGSYLIPILEQACIDNGVEILFNAPVTQLLTENGKITGVKAQGYTVHAQAVILATGGFGADLEMVSQLRPELKGFVTTCVPSATGDGIKMAQDVGAATVDMAEIQIHPTVEQKNAALITEGLRGDGAILVNAEGLRFCDEVGTRDVVSAAVLEQTGGYAYLILDQRMADASSVIEGYIKKGYTLQSDTYAGLAKAMGIPEEAFTGTMEKWNTSTYSGKDELFGRTSFSAALDTAPFYAIQVAPGIHHTMGGLKIDINARVTGTTGITIPGLFAAGEVTGGVHGANRLGGNATADFVVFGRIAGESAVEYLEQK